MPDEFAQSGEASEDAVSPAWGDRARSSERIQMWSGSGRPLLLLLGMTGALGVRLLVDALRLSPLGDSYHCGLPLMTAWLLLIGICLPLALLSLVWACRVTIRYTVATAAVTVAVPITTIVVPAIMR